MTTDTPRTDAAAGHAMGIINGRVLFCSRQLERELAEARQWLDKRYKHLSEADERAEKAEAEVERLRGLLNAHAEFLIKNGFYRESRDLMGGSWSDGFVALAKKCGINPYDQ